MRVHRNLVKVISPPTTSNSFTLSPEEMAKQMHTGRVPWQGLHILILPSTTLSKKRCFDQLEKLSHLGHEANEHKGKIGKVLDIGINQATASGLSVCVRLEQSYSAVHAYRDIWVDYDEVVEETYDILFQYIKDNLTNLASISGRDYPYDCTSHWTKVRQLSYPHRSIAVHARSKRILHVASD